MQIIKNRVENSLLLSQNDYLEKVIKRFSIIEAKLVQVPLAAHFKFTMSQSPTTEKEVKDMLNVPYANAIGSLMYGMIYSWPDIAYAVSVLSRYMANPRRVH